MVKKIFLAAVAALALGLTGCGQLPSTARPTNASSLSLSVPSPEGISAKFTLINFFIHYRVASGPEVYSGVVSLGTLPSTAGPINIDLPHDGQWLVSAEWTVNGNPAYIGADLANVTGTTPFALSLGTLNSSCYETSIASPGSNAGFPDTFTFDSNVTAYSPVTIAPLPDIQALLGATSMYLQTYPMVKPAFVYLGTGNWVDYVDIPAGAVFYNDSLTAKQAVMGATAVMAQYDVYAIKLSATNTAWIQVQTVVNTGATYVQFDYRLNRHGFSYLKFDVTAAGNASTVCNTSGNNLY